MKTVFLDFDSLRPADLQLDPMRVKLGDVELWPDTEPGELAARISTTDVAVVNKIRLDAAAMDHAPELKLICLAATGTDNVDMEAACERNIAVCNIRDYCTPSVVQHVFALILALNQNLPEQEALVAAGEWQKSPQFCLLVVAYFRQYVTFFLLLFFLAFSRC